MLTIVKMRPRLTHMVAEWLATAPRSSSPLRPNPRPTLQQEAATLIRPILGHRTVRLLPVPTARPLPTAITHSKTQARAEGPQHVRAPCIQIRPRASSAPSDDEESQAGYRVVPKLRRRRKRGRLPRLELRLAQPITSRLTAERQGSQGGAGGCPTFRMQGPATREWRTNECEQKIDAPNYPKSLIILFLGRLEKDGAWSEGHPGTNGEALPTRLPSALAETTNRKVNKSRSRRGLARIGKGEAQVQGLCPCFWTRHISPLALLSTASGLGGNAAVGARSSE
ncbi:hypothetical protein VUR80DRAFT_2412 [Thermomyces stellatus]